MIATLGEFTPKIAPNAFVAQTAVVLGQVTLSAQANIWYGTVLRGDVGTIYVGERTNIQDGSVVHVTAGMFDTHIGADVTIGHKAIVHGCRIEDKVLIGMGATVMDGAEIGSYSLIGAGALVTPGTKIPEGSLAVGSPARVVRSLKPGERDLIDNSAAHYVALAVRHAEELRPT